MNFNSSVPYLFKSQVSPDVYNSAISDSNGNLLFYTDGYTTWDRRNKVMPKTEYRWPWASEVMPLICPIPDNDSLYYIFGVSKGPYANKLQAITIDMKLNNGFGGIVYPPPPIDSTNYYVRLTDNASNFVAGTLHCNRRDYWIVTFAHGALYSYLVTSAGINPNPIISPVSSGIIPPKIYWEGNIKFSANSERLVFPLLNENKVVVFSFDNLTGKFSDPIKLGLPKDHYITDAELSVNGNNLYLTEKIYEDESLGVELHSVGQMNLKLNNAQAIQNSFYSFNDSYPSRTGWCTPHNCYLITPSLQLGPDGKIYITMREITGTNRDNTISVIEEPNELGINAKFTRDMISLGVQYQSIRYNYIRSTSVERKENAVLFRKNNCSDQPVSFSLLSSKVDSVRWDFGDVASGARNFSQEKNPQHIYSAPGVYKIHAIIYDRCAIDTVNTELTMSADKSVKIPSFVKDSTICTGDTLFMDATTPNATEYLWGGGNIKPIQPITVSGIYEVQASNICSIDKKQFKVTIEDCTCDVFVPNAFTPNYDGLNDYFRPIVKCLAKDFSFTIFNRFGQKIFYTNYYDGKGWNGKNGSELAPIGTYFWSLQYVNPNTKKIIKQNGKLVLIR